MRALFFILLSLPAFSSELETAEYRLERQIDLIEKIIPHTKRRDLPRLVVLRQVSETVRLSIDARGLGNAETLHEYQFLIARYRFLRGFLTSIQTDETEPFIAELFDVTDEIASSRGFDDSPYTKITYATFTQIHEMIRSLVALEISEELGNSLLLLDRAIGYVLGVSESGDQLCNVAYAIPLHRTLQLLYPRLWAESDDGLVEALIIPLMGLNDYFGDFAEAKSVRTLPCNDIHPHYLEILAQVSEGGGQ